MKYSHEDYDRAIRRAIENSRKRRSDALHERYDAAIKRALARFDAERDERAQEGEGGESQPHYGNTRLPYGLCKKFGIELPKGAKPHDAWAALAGKGITPEDTYAEVEEKGTVTEMTAKEPEQGTASEPVGASEPEPAQEPVTEPSQEPIEAQEEPVQEEQGEEQNVPQEAPENEPEHGQTPEQGQGGEQGSEKTAQPAEDPETAKKVAELTKKFNELGEGPGSGLKFKEYLNEIPEGYIAYNNGDIKSPIIPIHDEDTAEGLYWWKSGYWTPESVWRKYGQQVDITIIPQKEAFNKEIDEYNKKYEAAREEVEDVVRECLEKVDKGNTPWAIWSIESDVDGYSLGNITNTISKLEQLRLAQGNMAKDSELFSLQAKAKNDRLTKDIRYISAMINKAHSVNTLMSRYSSNIGKIGKYKTELKKYAATLVTGINNAQSKLEKAGDLASIMNKTIDCSKKVLAKALMFPNTYNGENPDTIFQELSNNAKAGIDKELGLIEKNLGKCDKLAEAGDKDGASTEARKLMDRLTKIEESLGKNMYNGQFIVGDKCEAQHNAINDYRDRLRKYVHSKIARERYALPDRKIDEKNGTAAFSDDCYSKERKDAATWCQSQYESKEVLGGQACEIYQNATQAEKDAIYAYTAGSGKFNRPLSGYHGTWNKRDFHGIGKTNLNHEGGEQMMKDLTDVIGRTPLKNDIWVQHGTDKQGIEAFLGTSVTEEHLRDLVETGDECHFSGFMSCGAGKNTGFDNAMYLVNVYCPKGTKGAYIAPGSGFGGRKDFDGTVPPPLQVGHENEMILQRDGNYRVTKFEHKDDRWFIDVEVLSQEPFDYSDYVYKKPN